MNNNDADATNQSRPPTYKALDYNTRYSFEPIGQTSSTTPANRPSNENDPASQLQAYDSRKD